MNSRPPLDDSANVPWWKELFPPGDAAADQQLISVRVCSKQGQPFLVLPQSARYAAAGLQLYPAQRRRARWLTRLLGGLLGMGLPVPLPWRRLPLPSQDPLVKFLSELSSAAHPPFAILAGNPSAAGRRFIALVWQTDGTAVVVKIGAGPNAQQLIEQEENFLRQIPTDFPGIPRLQKSFHTAGRSGFALPFIGGDSPATVTPPVVQLLQGWLRPAELVAAREVAAWRELSARCAALNGWPELAGVIEARPFARTVAHGDFTPWNVRSGGPDRARALDWERGEFPGMPAWDWFHFVIQSAILVRRQRGAALHQTCEALLRQEDFRAYAATAGLAGREREWLLAYLHHVIQVLRPAEGLPENQELLNSLTSNRDHPPKATVD